MQTTRRDFLALGRAGGAGLMLVGACLPLTAQAADMPDPLAANDQRKAFDTHTVDEVVRKLGGDGAQASEEIELTAPEIAESGATVPVTIQSHLPGTAMIAIVTEKNPRALTAVFHIPEGTEPYIETRVKMAETAALTALVQADGGFYTADRTVRVTIGGCGD